MPKNTKVDVASFKAKLKNGEYETLTGARRALGKVQGWTEKEKEAANALANKHFEGAPAPAAKKTAKKAPKKATTARAALAAKKAAPVAAEAAPVAAEAAPAVVGPGRGRKKKAASKPVPGKRAKRAPTAAGESVSERMTATANAMGMLKEGTSILQQIKEHGTNVDVTEGLRQIAATATRLMQQLDRIIVGPLSTQEQQALFAQAAPAVPPPGGNNASQSIV